MKRRISPGLALLLSVSMLSGCGAAPEAAGIPGWAADSPAMRSIVAYVAAVADESSPEHVPPEARVVLFGSDGTLIGERYPTYSDQRMLLQRLLHDEAGGDAPEAAAAFAADCAALGFETVSMRREFETIYAENVVMTGAEAWESAA